MPLPPRLPSHSPFCCKPPPTANPKPSGSLHPLGAYPTCLNALPCSGATRRAVKPGSPCCSLPAFPTPPPPPPSHPNSPIWVGRPNKSVPCSPPLSRSPACPKIQPPRPDERAARRSSARPCLACLCQRSRRAAPHAARRANRPAQYRLHAAAARGHGRHNGQIPSRIRCAGQRFATLRHARRHLCRRFHRAAPCPQIRLSRRPPVRRSGRGNSVLRRVAVVP